MSRALDLALCKALEIKPTYIDIDWFPVEEWPTLSTTGDGMLTLMRALESEGYNYMIGKRAGLPYDACVGNASGAPLAKADQAPMALALAAAAALGIEVPEC